MRAIARNDLRQLRASRDFWLPLGIMAALLFILVPLLMLSAVRSVKDPAMLDRFSTLLGSLPSSVQAGLPRGDAAARAGYSLAVFLFAPLITLVPLTVASAVAGHSFVGERERGSGEFLAHSPASTRDIWYGKLLAAMVPALGTALLGGIAYSLVVNLTLGSTVGGWFFPTRGWWVLGIWTVPPVLLLATALILRISTRAGSGPGAQQAASLVSLPLVVAAYFVAGKSLYEAPWLAWVAGGLAWIAAVWAVRRGAARLPRERMLGLGA